MFTDMIFLNLGLHQSKLKDTRDVVKDQYLYA